LPRWAHGLVIGKFLPPHKGHKHLIETARSQVDRLTVMICDKPEYGMDGQMRATWLRESVAPSRTIPARSTAS